MKTAILLLVILCAVILAATVAARLSTEAAAIVVGVVCGVGASIPVSLGLLLVLGRLSGLRTGAPVRWRLPGGQPVEQRNTPPVVVVMPGPAQPNPYPAPWLAGQAARTFRIIGEDPEVLHG